jgi:hypothetical protein
VFVLQVSIITSSIDLIPTPPLFCTLNVDRGTLLMKPPVVVTTTTSSGGTSSISLSSIAVSLTSIILVLCSSPNLLATALQVLISSLLNNSLSFKIFSI